MEEPLFPERNARPRRVPPGRAGGMILMRVRYRRGGGGGGGAGPARGAEKGARGWERTAPRTPRESAPRARGRNDLDASQVQAVGVVCRRSGPSPWSANGRQGLVAIPPAPPSESSTASSTVRRMVPSSAPRMGHYG